MKARAGELQRLNGDLAGGFAALLIGIPQSMSLGILAFAALGPAYAGVGMAAGLLAAAIGNLVAAATSTVRCQIVGPRSSAAALVAALMAVLVAHPSLQVANAPDVPRIVALLALTVLLAGMITVVFGIAGLGRAIKLTPYPVVAGFMNGIALIILISQIRPILGLAGVAPLSATLGQLGEARIGSVLVAAAALATAFMVPRWVRRAPPLLAGLIAGTIVHYAIEAAAPGSAGHVVGPLPHVELFPEALMAIAALDWRTEAWDWIAFLLPTALLVATVCSLDGLLAALGADALTRGRHDSNRELVSLGLGNLVVAGFGGLPVAGNSHTPLANFLNGGRTRRSTLFHALLLFAVLFVMGGWMAATPIAALSGLMVYIGIKLIDGWTTDLIRRSRAEREHRTELLVTIAVVAAVALSMIAFNVLFAAAFGVVAAMMLLVAKMSGSPVRRSLDGVVRSSRKVRTPQAATLLRARGESIRVLELDGEIFFGTADQLQSQIDALPEGTRFVILDFRRVHAVDATGARALGVIAQRCERGGVRVLLSNVGDDHPRGRYLRAMGVIDAVGAGHCFADLDYALEWAEERILESAGYREADTEIALRDTTVFATLDDDEAGLLAGALERLELRHGDRVFLEGEEGNRLYVLARGVVSIQMRLDDGSAGPRIAAFNPGVIFGEMALLEGKRRSADAYAVGESVVLYSLAGERFENLVQARPELGLKVYRNISRHLAWRLRGTSDALRALQ